jgi:pantoate--beta-alanine ligase
MDRVSEPEAFREACARARSDGRVVALVPTMGALHRGHMSLVAEAKRRADFVAVSVFVNPTQFGPNEDLDRYPRTLEADAARCQEAGVALLFAPSAAGMYPEGDETRVHVGATAEAFCGQHRPGHFEGVCTVVAKLLALTGPCVAVFGRKDYQQWRVLTRMARDLHLPVQIVGAPTVREPDGLALSSRNAYLVEAARERALAIPRGLSAAVAAFEAGERNAAELVRTVTAIVEPAVDRVDYIELANADTVRPLSSDERVQDKAVLALAAFVGTTRLIDNVVLGEDPAPILGPKASKES